MEDYHIIGIFILFIAIVITGLFIYSDKIMNRVPPHIPGIGGKLGSSLVLKDFESFCTDVVNGDYIFFYDPKVFKEHRKIPDRRKDLLHYNGTFYPMWDNKTKNNHNFIALRVYDEYDSIINYPPGSLKRLDNLLRPFDLMVTIQQYTDNTGSDTYKDKLPPVYLVTYNSNYEILAYNTDKKVIYILQHQDLKEFLSASVIINLRNLFYIGLDTYNVEYSKFPGTLPWTFNWEGVRSPNDIVCTLPSKRTGKEVDNFTVPEQFIKRLHSYPNRSKIEF